MTATNPEPARPAPPRDAIFQAMGDLRFQPAWWLPNGHWQTMWGPLCRIRPRNPIRKEAWDTGDGDALNVYFCDGEPGQPVVVLLHGLEGSVRSKYIQGLVRACRRRGWTAVVMEYRTCDGVLNRAQRMYHAGETTDLGYVVDTLCARLPESPIFLAGVSLGGNVLGKWLGEEPDRVPTAVHGAALISAPFDLARCAEHIDKARDGFYARWFLRSLIPKALAKAEQIPGVMDVERIRAARTFWEYDTYATAALHGFDSAEDYWGRSSCGQYLAAIRVPTLIVSAEDDPFTPGDLIPRDVVANTSWLIPCIVPHGGHVGFVGGRSPASAHYWLDALIPRFFAAVETVCDSPDLRRARE